MYSAIIGLYVGIRSCCLIVVFRSFISLLIICDVVVWIITLTWNKVSVAHSCLTLFDPMDCGLPVSSVHGILQGRIPEWVAIPSSRGSFWPRFPALRVDSLLSEPPAKYFSNKHRFIQDQQKIAIWGLQPWKAICRSLQHKGRRAFLPRRKDVGKNVVKKQAFHWLRPCQGRSLLVGLGYQGRA